MSSKKNNQKAKPARKTNSQKPASGPSPSQNALSFTNAKNEEIRVREVENGFVVSKSGTIGKGKNQTYYNKEYISPTNPLAIKSTGNIRFGGAKK